MKIAVCGYGRCGKDTTCQWLRRNTNLNYTMSTSEAAAKVVFREIGQKYAYKSVVDCWQDRHSRRPEWAEIIWKYNQPDGLTLYRDMINNGHQVINGIRKTAELHECVRAGLVDLTIWVERPGAMEGKESCQITQSDCHLTLMNDGSLEQLFSKLDYITRAWGILTSKVPY